MYEKLELGFSPMTERIYLGRTNPKKRHEWAGEKRDMTSNFIAVMLQKFEPNTETTLTVDGVKTYTITVKEIGRKKSNASQTN